MEQDAAERWIVNLIRNAQLDAKIDSANNQIIMGTQYPTMYATPFSFSFLLSFHFFLFFQRKTKIVCLFRMERSDVHQLSLKTFEF